jgi:hypothetical protein
VRYTESWVASSFHIIPRTWELLAY